MGNSRKPSQPIARQSAAVLTPEQKQEAMLRFFTQKRESFATGILFNLCQNPNIDINAGNHLVNVAVSMADKMIEKLYPLKNESETIKAE